jgi:hypothetical protein
VELHGAPGSKRSAGDVRVVRQTSGNEAGNLLLRLASTPPSPTSAAADDPERRGGCHSDGGGPRRGPSPTSLRATRIAGPPGRIGNGQRRRHRRWRAARPHVLERAPRAATLRQPGARSRPRSDLRSDPAHSREQTARHRPSETAVSARRAAARFGWRARIFSASPHNERRGWKNVGPESRRRRKSDGIAARICPPSPDYARTSSTGTRA